jgi:glycosyltransferase involved in cell wall biosynthesis
MEERRPRDRQLLPSSIANHIPDDSPIVAIPLAYAFDEPVDELLGAARMRPGISFVLTGNAPERVVTGAPDNVHFTGWISSTEYEALIACCDAVACLTTRSATMQTTLIEAVEYGKPAVISDTTVLRDWRGEDDMAHFTSHSPTELAIALAAAVDARPSVTSGRRREELIARSHQDIDRLRKELAS